MTAPAHTYRAVWRGIGLTVTWTPGYYATQDGSYAVAHLQIHADDRAPLPVTETGYKSRFIQREAVEAEGGPVAYVLAWLDHAARAPAWQKREAAARQLSLF